MKNLTRVFLVTILGSLTVNGISQSYDEVWQHINNNDRNKAKAILEAKIKSKTNSVDEYLTYILLKGYDANESEITDFLAQITKAQNPSPYIYSLWFNDCVIGEGRIKPAHQVNLLKALIGGKIGNGSLKCAAHYNMGMAHLGNNQLANVAKENANMGALEKWQFVGPFNNLSGSGFNKNYEPITNPSNETEFISASESKIKWFTPAYQSTEGWMMVGNYISESAGGLTFAQTFVNSPSDQEVILCSGFNGTIKIWVNDELIISVDDEKITELDTYNARVKLKQGYNRIVVQTGADDNASNFIVRLTDDNYNPVKGLTSIGTPQEYTKLKGNTPKPLIPHFAEVYLNDKIKAEPKNLLNYILLCKVYMRNLKIYEARTILDKAFEIAPESNLLKLEKAICYLREGNRTGVTEIYSYLKENDQQSYVSYAFRIAEMKEQEKYQEALDTLERMVRIFGNDDESIQNRIELLAKLNMIPQLISEINSGYKQSPDNKIFVNLTYTIEKNVNKNPKKAIKVLEAYCNKHFDSEMNEILFKEYYEQGDMKKPLQKMVNYIKFWPFDPSFKSQLMREYTNQQMYNEAKAIAEDLVKMKPYSGFYYEDLAQVEEAMNLTDDASKHYSVAFKYQPTLYDSREKQRILQKQKRVFDYFPQTKIDDLVKSSGSGFKDAYDYSYLLIEKYVVLYPEGGSEELNTYSIKVLNERGIDRYSDFTLPYNSSNESLIIEEAIIVKSNGKKIKPEISENHVVCTGLEVNDVIYVRYNTKSYTRGKFAREFYDQFTMGDFNPVGMSRYGIIVPNNKTLQYTSVNGKVEPTITDFENNKMYIWENKNSEAIVKEPYMPAASDHMLTLHLSTLKDWNEIAQWYADLTYSKIAHTNDYEVQRVYNELFKDKKNLKADEKAKIIYDYIAKNINYSSVSFRQGPIIPQKAATTLTTHLGDCKDISTLFVSLAKLCGLKANLVLVNTRDNGVKEMVLPSFSFNHCIAMYTNEEGKEQFMEITDRTLPFKSLPANLYKASALIIPEKDEAAKNYNLSEINVKNKTRDRLYTVQKIEITGSDFQITNHTRKFGSLSSDTRFNYKDLNTENTKKKMQDFISKKFSNPVEIQSVDFEGLNELLDSVGVITKFKVSNEVKKIGAQSAFKIPFIDVVFSADPFSISTRKTDFEYWDYENSDEYTTIIELTLPVGSSFVETPKDLVLSYNNTSYSIKFVKKSPTRLDVIRKVQINRDNVSPAEYEKFKAFVTKVIDTEGSYITIK